MSTRDTNPLSEHGAMTSLKVGADTDTLGPSNDEVHNTCTILKFRAAKKVVYPAGSYQAENYHVRREIVLEIASQIEPALEKRMAWFEHDGIAQFHGLTAKEMLLQRMDDMLVAFLAAAIGCDRRDRVAVLHTAGASQKQDLGEKWT